MGMSLYVVSVDSEALDGLTPGAAIELLLSGWSVDQFGWAVAGLPFGEGGVGVFGHSASSRFGAEVQVMSSQVRDNLANQAAGEETIRDRYRSSAFGVELGPLPSPSDEDWLVGEVAVLVEFDS